MEYHCFVFLPWHLYLDVKLEVLVHGVDVVEDVVGDARDDSHQLGVVQFALNTATDTDVWMRLRGAFSEERQGSKVELKRDAKTVKQRSFITDSGVRSEN